MNQSYPILLQCSRLSHVDKPPIDLIIDSNYESILECYEHLSITSSYPEGKKPQNIQEFQGELLEVTAIKCDPCCPSEEVLAALLNRLRECQINIENMSLEYLQDIIWPNENFTLRCVISENSPKTISFLSPTNFHPKFSLS
jgi:hypothetical protein